MDNITDTGVLASRITVTRMTGGGGAEMTGIDLSRPLDEATLSIIDQAFLDHHVLVFRDQEITAAHQVTFAEHFGTITETPMVRKNGDGTTTFLREADAPSELWTFGNYWHLDGPYSERPPVAAMLYAVESPPYGGDTIFSNVAQAYETLSPLMKEIAERLIVAYNPQVLLNKLTASRVREDLPELKPLMEHPLVCVHPQTGRKGLLISGDIAVGVAGMSTQESRPLLDFFHQHAHREEFQIRVRWTKGAVTLWDNRALQHYAVDDYSGFRREMRRVEIGGGTIPEGPARWTAHAVSPALEPVS